MDAARRDLASLEALKQPALAPVIGTGGLDDGRLWVATRLSEDQGLDERLAAQGPLPLPQLLALGRNLCAALASLHHHGTVHGGLTPALLRYERAAEGLPTGPVLAGAGWASLRDGIANYPEIITAMKDIGFDGYLSIEDLRKDVSPKEKVADGIAYLKGLVESSERVMPI